MITKVAQFSSTPTAVSDYEAQNAHLMAFINQVNSQAFILTNPTGTTEPTIKQDTYINHGGTLYTVDTADESITGSPADGNVYIKLSVSGSNLVASYVTDISAFTWNQVYGYLANGTDIILPYMLVKSGTSWAKYRMDIKTPQYVTDQNLRTTDSPTFATVNTGQGANELYAMNQNLRTTDSPTFSDATISGHTIDSELDTLNSRVNQGVKTTDSPTFATVNTGQGANELYAMNQNVRTTDSPTFAGLNLTQSTHGYTSGLANDFWTPGSGMYVFAGDTENVEVQIYNGSGWTTGAATKAGTIITDGINVRIKFLVTSGINYRKF
jgi:hypothetical protein